MFCHCSDLISLKNLLNNGTRMATCQRKAIRFTRMIKSQQIDWCVLCKCLDYLLSNEFTSILYLHDCNYWNGFILGGNGFSVYMHDLVNVCLLCNIGKTETFMLFCMHCDYLIGFIWGKMGFRRASIIKRKLMRFSGSNLSRFTCMIWLVFVCYATKTESSYAIYAVIVIASYAVIV